MSDRRTFVDLALAGEIVDPDEEVDAFIEGWHRSDSELDLAQWLGFTDAEYALFVEKPAFLRAILMARRSHISLAEAVTVASRTTALAARGVDPDDIPKIRTWLEQTGRL